MKATTFAIALAATIAAMTAAAPEARADCQVTLHPMCLIFGG
jgi:hypothetical protein